MNIIIFGQHIFPIKTPRAHRTTELVKELARRGHHVVVYAVLGIYDYTSFEHEYKVEVKNLPVSFELIPYSSDGNGKRHLIDKVLSRLLGKVFEFPYIEFLYSIPKIIANERKYDVVISISEPHHIHWGCSKAKEKYPEIFPKTWIADSGDPFFDNGNSRLHYRRFIKQERKFCESCSYLTVPVKEAINGYYPEYKEKIKIIPQGFPFDLPIRSIEPKNKNVTFAFAGMFYKDIRNPQKFLEYISSLSIDFTFIVYTPHKGIINEYIQKLKGKLIIHNPIDRCLLIEELKKVDFLVNIENINSPNQVPSKLIDYALTGRPILTLNPNNFDYDLINEFLSKNYKRKLIIDNIEQYHISNVVDKFLALM